MLETPLQANFFGRRTLSAIIQSETSECGLACLAMIANYYGAGTTLAQLRANNSGTRMGTNLADLTGLAQQQGLSLRAVRLSLGELGQLSTPCILHWDMNHFVVLAKVSRRRVHICDPSSGERTLSLAEASEHFTGIAAELSPSPSFKPSASTPDPLRIGDLWRSLHGLWSSLAQLLLLALLLQGLALGAPMLNQLLVDDALSRQNADLLSVIVLGLGLMLLVEVSVGLLRSHISLYVTNSLSLQLQNNVASHLLRLPMRFFEARHVGDISSRFGSLEPVRRFLTSELIGVILDGLLAITTLVLMALYSVTLTLITLGALCVHLLTHLCSYPVIKRRAREELVKQAQLDSVFLENLRAMQSIKSLGREPERLQRWQAVFVAALNQSIRLARLQLHLGAAQQVLLRGADLVVLWLAATLVINGNFTLGMLFAFQTYRSQCVARCTALLQAYFNWKMLTLHLERLGDLVREPPEPDGGRRLTQLVGRVCVQSVSFRYSDVGGDILRNVSLTVPAGELLVISGESGGGKTTLLKLLLAFLQPQSGTIAYDDVSLSLLSRQHLRRQLGVVMQNDALLAGSVRDNLSGFDPNPSEARLERACVAAGVHQDISLLPMGYDTLVGDLGNVFSGGQQQRLLLARALYGRPKILLMDEGTANLDPAAEHWVVDQIRAMPITRIVVAHRSAFIRAADRHLLLGRNGFSRP